MGFETDLNDSAYNFMHIVYPKLIECGYLSGDVVPIESVSAKGITKDLDMYAGIDAWHIDKNKGIQGIASRIQFINHPWNSFTIRKSRTSGAKTEYEKRVYAIETGDWLYPTITIQAYITSRTNGELLSVGIAKTNDIFKAIECGNCIEKPNPADGNMFYAVFWKDISDSVNVWKK